MQIWFVQICNILPRQPMLGQQDTITAQNNLCKKFQETVTSHESTLACLNIKLRRLRIENGSRRGVLYRVGSSSRFYSSLFRLDDSDEFNCKLKPPTDCISSEVLSAVNEGFCPRISATRNMARILNSVEYNAGVVWPAESGCPRWDVMQDAKALYIVRDMSGFPRKDEIFREDPGIHVIDERTVVFGCTRVCQHFGGMVTFTVGTDGPDPGASYQGYSVRMWLPKRYSSVRDIKMGVKDEVLTVIVPKGRKGKWIHRFTMLPDFYSP